MYRHLILAVAFIPVIAVSQKRIHININPKINISHHRNWSPLGEGSSVSYVTGLFDKRSDYSFNWADRIQLTCLRGIRDRNVIVLPHPFIYNRFYQRVIPDIIIKKRDVEIRIVRDRRI